MLRSRYRSVTRKQANMDEHSFLSSPSPNHTKPISYFFGSPRFSNRFLPNSPYVSETMSPTSILDNKPFSVNTNPFVYDQNLAKLPTTFPGNKQFSEKSEAKPIGLALIDSIIDEKPGENTSKPNSRKVLFGSKLKIQIPTFPQSALSHSESPKSPADFGTKTRNSICSSPFGSGNSSIQTKTNGFLSVSEMELSEDYTCVITHGPNPTTTHIYDNSIVESCVGVSGVGSDELKNGFCSLPKKPNFPPKNFLSFCYTCNKNLGERDDIFMYRGEKAFCCRECRFQEMIIDRENNTDFGGCF